jgi:hypothetical protein
LLKRIVKVKWSRDKKSEMLEVNGCGIFVTIDDKNKCLEEYDTAEFNSYSKVRIIK